MNSNQERQKLVCPKCGTMAKKRGRPQPLLSTVMFCLSAVAFLFGGAQRAGPVGIWVWSGIQIGLGIWVIAGRIRARRSDFLCIPCGEKLRLKD